MSDDYRSELFEANGAAIMWWPEKSKWGVYDAVNMLHGWRRDRDVAVAFAMSLPRTEPEFVPPQHVLDRSERALPPPAELRAPMGLPKEERQGFDFRAKPEGAPVELKRDPIAENREWSQRQYRKFDEDQIRRRQRRR
jgi:hypothetical protein